MRGCTKPTVPCAPGRGCASISSASRGRQVGELPRQVVGDEADVVDAFAARSKEPGNAALVVDRLDQLDPRRRLGAGRQEAEAHALHAEDDRIGFRRQPEELPIPGQ